MSYTAESWAHDKRLCALLVGGVVKEADPVFGLVIEITTGELFDVSDHPEGGLIIEAQS